MQPTNSQHATLIPFPCWIDKDKFFRLALVQAQLLISGVQYSLLKPPNSCKWLSRVVLTYLETVSSKLQGIPATLLRAPALLVSLAAYTLYSHNGRWCWYCYSIHIYILRKYLPTGCWWTPSMFLIYGIISYTCWRAQFFQPGRVPM